MIELILKEVCFQRLW